MSGLSCLWLGPSEYSAHSNLDLLCLQKRQALEQKQAQRRGSPQVWSHCVQPNCVIHCQNRQVTQAPQRRSSLRRMRLKTSHAWTLRRTRVLLARLLAPSSESPSGWPHDYHLTTKSLLESTAGRVHLHLQPRPWVHGLATHIASG